MPQIVSSLVSNKVFFSCFITHCLDVNFPRLVTSRMQQHFWPVVSCPRFLVLNNALFCHCILFSCCYATSTELDAASCSWSTQATTSTAASNGNLRREASVLLWYVRLQSDCHLFLDVTCTFMGPRELKVFSWGGQTSILFWNNYIASLLIYQFFGSVKILKISFPLDLHFVVKKILISSINNIFTYYMCTFCCLHLRLSVSW